MARLHCRRGGGLSCLQRIFRFFLLDRIPLDRRSADLERARRAYIDYFYLSIETLSTAGYGDMHPYSHYGHFVATIELFTGIFSMSLMIGLIFARFFRPSARRLFANNPVVSSQRACRP